MFDLAPTLAWHQHSEGDRYPVRVLLPNALVRGCGFWDPAGAARAAIAILRCWQDRTQSMSAFAALERWVAEPSAETRSAFHRACDALTSHLDGMKYLSSRLAALNGADASAEFAYTAVTATNAAFIATRSESDLEVAERLREAVQVEVLPWALFHAEPLGADHRM